MSRKPVKTVSNEPTEVIPEAYKDLERNAPEMLDRPLIFIGRKTNRDEQWAIQDYIELKDKSDADRGVKGMGEAYKYLWENIILEVKNVVSDKGNVDSVKGDDKNALWYAEGMEDDITEAITHFHYTSKLDEGEVKTSD